MADAEAAKGYIPEKEQFHLGDIRSLDEVVREVVVIGRTVILLHATEPCVGDHFMSLAKPGFVHKYCMTNALLTFKEYLLTALQKKPSASVKQSYKNSLRAFEKKVRKKKVC